MDEKLVEISGFPAVVSANSSKDNFKPSEVANPDMSTYWQSSGDARSVFKVDFESPQSIGALVVHTASQDRSPSYEITIKVSRPKRDICCNGW